MQPGDPWQPTGGKYDRQLLASRMVKRIETGSEPVKESEENAES